MSIALTMTGVAAAAMMQAASGAEPTAEPEMIFPEGMTAVTERLNAESPQLATPEDIYGKPLGPIFPSTGGYAVGMVGEDVAEGSINCLEAKNLYVQNAGNPEFRSYFENIINVLDQAYERANARAPIMHYDMDCAVPTLNNGPQ